MPVNYQIVPEHVYPHQMVQINDNTEVQATYSSGSSDITGLLCVFASPKGRDNQVYTIDTGISGFMKEYGLGPFSLYGQPLLNAYAAASTNQCLLHCLRVTANDATYAATIIMARYEVTGTNMTIRLYAKTPEGDLTTASDLEDQVMKEPEANDTAFEVPLFSVNYIGKGTYGNSLRFRIVSDKTTDKENQYKNYFLGVYSTENGMFQEEQFTVTFTPDSVYNGTSLYAPDVTGLDAEDGSQFIRVIANPTGFQAIFEAYKAVNPDTYLTAETFDPLLGIDKTTRGAITNLTIAPEEAEAAEDGTQAVALNSTTGVALMNGADGSLAADAPDRQTTLDNLYLQAFSGTIDPLIRSKNRFPTTFILDANYPVNVKQAIAALAIARTDCMAMIDCGTTITTKASVKSYVDSNLDSYVANRVLTIEPYCMKVRDPYSQKAVVVTSTYWIAGNYPTHIYNYGGKHRPMAGNRFGVMSGFIKNSVYPIFDEDLDSELMDELAEAHINFAKYNANQECVRAMQDTRQDKLTVLSEQNNMLIVLDIKRDAERISAQFEYDFSEPEDLARFNSVISGLVDKYAAAQVRSITAVYTKNEWEAERNYIHLNIALVCRGLVRTTIIEIDVNRE